MATPSEIREESIRQSKVSKYTVSSPKGTIVARIEVQALGASICYIEIRQKKGDYRFTEEADFPTWEKARDHIRDVIIGNLEEGMI